LAFPSSQARALELLCEDRMSSLKSAIIVKDVSAW
jgi:hypothetical protein